MKIEFSSKVYAGKKSSGILFRFLFLLAGGVILLTVIVKMLAGDLHMADYGGILFSVFLIWKGNRGGRGVPQYIYTDGEITFEEDHLTIQYGNTRVEKDTEIRQYCGTERLKVLNMERPFIAIVL